MEVNFVITVNIIRNMTPYRYLILDEVLALIVNCTDRVGLSQHRLYEKYKVSKGAIYNIPKRENE